MSINISSGMVVSIAILLAIDLMILLGNSLILLAVITSRRLQTVTNLYVASLAVADLLVAMTVLPLTILHYAYQYWPLSEIWCAFLVSTDIALCTASILNLCCISLDRYMAITRPLKYAAKRSYKLAFTMIFAAWVLSIIISIPPLLGGWAEHNFKNGSCSISTNLAYRIYSSMGSFYIPLILMIYVYCRIFFTAKNRKFCTSPAQNNFSDITTNSPPLIPAKIRQKSRRKAVDYNDTEASIEHEYSGMNVGQKPLHRSTALQNMIFKSGNLQNFTNLSTGCVIKSNTNKSNKEKAAFLREHKTAKIIALVIGCFVICWLPFFTVYLLEAICEYGKLINRFHCGIYFDTLTWQCVTWLGYVNSAFNPFLYAFYNREYSRAFKNILTCHNLIAT